MARCVIGQPEQHTTTASVQRNYHGSPRPRPGPFATRAVYAASIPDALRRRRTCRRTLDAAAVRAWCGLALDALGGAREEIDAINVYPVADGDTGTNLYLTVESAARAVDAAFDGGLAPAAPRPGRGRAGDGARRPDRGPRQLRHDPGAAAARHGARSSAADSVTADRRRRAGRCARALRRAAEAAYQAVAHPVEGTVLTVATAAADAADATPRGRATAGRWRGPPTTVRAAALDATPGQLAVLGRAGVVDAGGRGLVAVLGALVGALSGEAACRRTGRVSAAEGR